jgi:hypothetical protein
MEETKAEIISEAYPPEKQLENKRQAECHRIIKKNRIKIDPNKIKFILYKKGMDINLKEIKALHKE